MTIVSGGAAPSQFADKFTDIPAGLEAERHSVADVTELLMGEFGAQLDLSVISKTVLDCRDDLMGSPGGAAPELVERLARQRLLPTEPLLEVP